MKTYKRTFKARFVDNFYEAFLKYAMVGEGLTLSAAMECYGGKDLFYFASTINGKVVTLVETAYIDGKRFIGTDCVVETDGEWIMPESLYVEVAA